MYRLWWGNNQRKQAIEWAIKYGDSVTKKDFSNMTMEVLPFKNNGSQENIDLAGIMDKLVDGLNKFKVDVVASPESVDTYIKSDVREPLFLLSWLGAAAERVSLVLPASLVIPTTAC